MKFCFNSLLAIMNKEEYGEKIRKENEYLMGHVYDSFENFGKKFGLKFNKKKYLKLKYQKSYYYNDTKFDDLARQFIYFYSILCKTGKIELKYRMEELSHTKGYDIDVITILSILKKICETEGEKVTNADLILLWGLLFDKEVNKHKKWRNEYLRKFLKKQKIPKDYTNFFELKDEKYLRHNSFQKYKGKLTAKKLKMFLSTLFETCDRLPLNSMNNMYCSQFFTEWFYIFVCNLKLEGLKKIKGKNNYDVIMEISKHIKNEELDMMCKNSRVLDYIYKYYTDIFLKSFLKK